MRTVSQKIFVTSLIQELDENLEITERVCLILSVRYGMDVTGYDGVEVKIEE